MRVCGSGCSGGLWGCFVFFFFVGGGGWGLCVFLVSFGVFFWFGGCVVFFSGGL